jgi:two-component system response regulator FixJ
MNNPTVFIVEDDQAVADALTCLFNSIKLPVEHFSDAYQFLEHFNPKRKGCLLLDVRMPGMSGLDLQERLKQQYHNYLPIIFLTGHGDIAMAVRAMKAGAFDFIVKPFNNHVLLEQVQRAIALKPQLDQVHNTKTKLATLTPREQQILSLIVNGRVNKQIANELSIAVSTVELHRSNIMKKMQAKSIAELIKNYLSILPA